MLRAARGENNTYQEDVSHRVEKAIFSNYFPQQKKNRKQKKEEDFCQKTQHNTTKSAKMKKTWFVQRGRQNQDK